MNFVLFNAIWILQEKPYQRPHICLDIMPIISNGSLGIMGKKNWPKPSLWGGWRGIGSTVLGPAFWGAPQTCMPTTPPLCTAAICHQLHTLAARHPRPLLHTLATRHPSCPPLRQIATTFPPTQADMPRAPYIPRVISGTGHNNSDKFIYSKKCHRSSVKQ